MYDSQHSTAARSGKASVPMVDLAPPRGPSRLSFVPRTVRAASSCSASQRCMFDGGRRSAPADIFGPRPAGRRRPGRGGPAAGLGRAGGPGCRAISPTIWSQLLAVDGQFDRRCVTSRHIIGRPPASIAMPRPCAVASIFLEDSLCSIARAPLGRQSRQTSTGVGRSVRAVITSGPRRAYFSGKPRSKAQAAARQYCSFFAALRMFLTSPIRRCTLPGRVVRRTWDRARLRVGSSVASSRRSERPCSGCIPR